MVEALEEEVVMTRRFVRGLSVARPARTNPPTEPARTTMSMAHVTPEAHAVLERACRDCHSNDTRWPWYSNVAPISWFVIDHVNHGRRHFNYSDWAQYDRDQVPRLLKNTCELTRKEEMPIASYLWLHPEARVTDRDIVALCDWTDGLLREALESLIPNH